MRILRRTLLSTALAATLLVGPVTAASATHTGCAHHTTGNAHSTVPHADDGDPNEHGLHTAHGSIPYCPPEDAPRHAGGNGHDGGH